MKIRIMLIFIVGLVTPFSPFLLGSEDTLNESLKNPLDDREMKWADDLLKKNEFSTLFFTLKNVSNDEGKGYIIDWIKEKADEGHVSMMYLYIRFLNTRRTTMKEKKRLFRYILFSLMRTYQDHNACMQFGDNAGFGVYDLLFNKYKMWLGDHYLNAIDIPNYAEILQEVKVKYKKQKNIVDSNSPESEENIVKNKVENLPCPSWILSCNKSCITTINFNTPPYEKLEAYKNKKNRKVIDSVRVKSLNNDFFDKKKNWKEFFGIDLEQKTSSWNPFNYKSTNQ